MESLQMENIRPRETMRRDSNPSTPTVRTTDEARQGVTGHNVRYVLGIGLIAVIIGFVLVYLLDHSLFFSGPT